VDGRGPGVLDAEDVGPAETFSVAREGGAASTPCKSLPLREVSTDDGVTVRVYFVGPVRGGGRDERLAYYDIQVGFPPLMA
jgi:hypothetical protein